MNDSPILIVMRLDDMTLLHPDQIESSCSRCGKPVGIFPSGQRVLKDAAAQGHCIPIVCHVCYRVEPVDIAVLAPGAEQERSETYRKEKKDGNS